ncbi:Ragulator complex protein LAMTOR3-B [Glomus cerebriforme]|uniref:Ragulator complex protein LAMTOR3-B n=1 Tax=Glomus cerebriforme TaxID=658196 RepID=A0A397TC21_9GLOM|nr:Ragulator complex protein LAMTOR3-B [Glomus cerebriforme]
MGEEIQAYFDKLLTRIDGLKAVTVTDRDGVILIKSVSNNVSPRILEPALSTTFAVVSEQASKLGLKKNKSIVSLFGLFQIVQFNHTPLITTLVADSDSNTGVLLDLGDELKDVTDIIASALSERQVIV